MTDGTLQIVCSAICIICVALVYSALRVLKQLLDEFKKCIEEEDKDK